MTIHIMHMPQDLALVKQLTALIGIRKIELCMELWDFVEIEHLIAKVKNREHGTSTTTRRSFESAHT